MVQLGQYNSMESGSACYPRFMRFLRFKEGVIFLNNIRNRVSGYYSIVDNRYRLMHRVNQVLIEAFTILVKREYGF